LDQGVDHLVFEDVADDLAALEDDALALARGDAQVGLARLAGAVDHAPQDAHLDRRPPPRQPLLHLGDDLLQVDVEPAAGRAGDQLRLAHRRRVACRMSNAAWTSGTGSPSRLMRMVSPMPS